MNIAVSITNIQPPDERHDALAAVVADANAVITAENTRRAALTPPGEPLALYTPQTYLESLLNKACDSYKKQRYDAAIKRLGDAAAQLPYAERLALIATVEEQVAP